MAIENSKDKIPAGVLAAVRTTGRKLPFEAVGGEAIGDIVERDAITATQSIGIVTDIGKQFGVTASAKAANPTPVLAAAREDITLQVVGVMDAPKAAVSLTDGERLQWSSGNSNFEQDATGAHLAVGAYGSGDARVQVDINVIPGPHTP